MNLNKIVNAIEISINKIVNAVGNSINKIKEFETNFDNTVDVWFERNKYKLLTITAICDVSVIVILFSIT